MVLSCGVAWREPEGLEGVRKVGRWWEFQANQAIGSLLLARLLMNAFLDQSGIELDSFGNRVLNPAQRESLPSTDRWMIPASRSDSERIDPWFLEIEQKNSFI